jgi:Holliday junction resolvase
MPTTNKGARYMGGRAEALLHRELTDAGYEVRRTHLSAFPDIIAWNTTEFLMIEVKARSVTGKNKEKGVVTAVLRLFNNSAKELKVVHNDARLLCYLRINDAWIVYEWSEAGTKEVGLVSERERYA